MSDIENKYITTGDYNKITKKIVANNIKIKELVEKSAIAELISKSN